MINRYHVKDEADRYNIPVFVNSNTNALLNQHLVDEVATYHNDSTLIIGGINKDC